VFREDTGPNCNKFCGLRANSMVGVPCRLFVFIGRFANDTRYHGWGVGVESPESPRLCTLAKDSFLVTVTTQQ
jgi:hypothetical protein